MVIVIRHPEEHDDVENVDCGDDDLNNDLNRHAWTNQEKSSIGVSHVAVDDRENRRLTDGLTRSRLEIQV